MLSITRPRDSGPKPPFDLPLTGHSLGSADVCHALFRTFRVSAGVEFEILARAAIARASAWAVRGRDPGYRAVLAGVGDHHGRTVRRDRARPRGHAVYPLLALGRPLRDRCGGGADRLADRQDERRGRKARGAVLAPLGCLRLFLRRGIVVSDYGTILGTRQPRQPLFSSLGHDRR